MTNNDLSYYETLVTYQANELKELKEYIHKLKQHIIKIDKALPRNLQRPS